MIRAIKTTDRAASRELCLSRDNIYEMVMTFYQKTLPWVIRYFPPDSKYTTSSCVSFRYRAGLENLQSRLIPQRLIISMGDIHIMHTHTHTDTHTLLCLRPSLAFSQTVRSMDETLFTYAFIMQQCKCNYFPSWPHATHTHTRACVLLCIYIHTSECQRCIWHDSRHAGAVLSGLPCGCHSAAGDPARAHVLSLVAAPL